jgi:predicted amidophosphoribosyltransferase
VLAALLDLVLPQPCAGCGGPGPWCASCGDVLALAARRPLGRHAPDPVPSGFPPASAAAVYDGPVRGALLAHKERGRLGLVVPLSAALAAAVRELAPPPDAVLVPIPSSRSAVRARGHDHALRLARRAGRELGLAAVPLLAPARRIDDSAGLDARRRAANLAGAFRLRGTAGVASVVLVDDVVTTGASLAEASRTLTSAGVRVAGAATVAATTRTWRQRLP